MLGQQILQECYWEHNVCYFLEICLVYDFIFLLQLSVFKQEDLWNIFFEVEERVSVYLSLTSLLIVPSLNLQLGRTNVT